MLKKLKVVQNKNGVFLADQHGNIFENVIVSAINQDKPSDANPEELGPGNLILSFSSLEYSV